MSSIESSRSGRPGEGGGRAGSGADPARDGERWAREALAALPGLRAVAILGLGGGHHVKALLEADPGLATLVIESDADLARETLRLFPGIPARNVCVESDWSRLLDHERVRSLTHAPFAVLKHGPSCQADGLFYQRAEALILARDRTGFFLQLRDRPALLRCVSRDRLEAVPVGPVSIRTVLELINPESIKPGAAEEREALLWKTLGELVK